MAGVIGGADGPTTTYVVGFVSGSPVGFLALVGGGLLLLALVGGFILSVAKRNND